MTPETRAGLPAHGITVADDVLFVAGLHDTTTDEITLYDDCPAATHKDRLAQTRRWLKAAGAQARVERAMRLPGGRPRKSVDRARRHTGQSFGPNGGWQAAPRLSRPRAV